MTGQTFGVQPSELFISSDKCILLLFLVRRDLLFESFIAHSDMFRRSGLIRRYSLSCYFPVTASLVQAAGKMVIQVLDYRDIEPQMSILISTYDSYRAG